MKIKIKINMHIDMIRVCWGNLALKSAQLLLKKDCEKVKTPLV